MLTKLALGVTTTTAVVSSTYAYRYFQQTRTDPLTGLGNRAALVAAFERVSRRRRGLVAVALGDMNGFKVLNDTRGHRFGDAVLREVAAVWEFMAFRGELPVRLHGDEFAVFIPWTTRVQEAQQRAREYQDAVSTITVVHDKPVEVSMSLGVMTGHAGTTTLSALLASADDRMYGDKHEHYRNHTKSRISVSQ
ncbi:GGDEF domain-containing protein [Saccharopolyspora erythraea]|uniref:GGDEF domain-containing protein n=1 Tax=Saccharopolyspora erythraea TaxID=1836 RepID=UPI001BA97D15|nr:GGDEF domain-containing protein [Saccharopolyspora erythraea]QUG99587.1 GGDEF domain-containing protein [Saccharopolyspora erythraea]